jgi:AbrB family looped-hinge helix DNA binding protein
MGRPQCLQAMAGTSVVSAKGQITVPKDLRERHNLSEGTTVTFTDTEDGVLVRAARKTLRGLAKGRLDVERAEHEIRSHRQEWSP